MEDPTYQPPREFANANFGSHEDDDRHEVESAPHRNFQDPVLVWEIVSDGHHLLEHCSVLKNVKVIN